MSDLAHLKYLNLTAELTAELSSLTVEPANLLKATFLPTAQPGGTGCGKSLWKLVEANPRAVCKTTLRSYKIYERFTAQAICRKIKEGKSSSYLGASAPCSPTRYLM